MIDATTASTTTPTSRKHRLSILCVGDGDLTLSLALIRAYGKEQIDLTASTLLSSPDELVATYANSSTVLNELKERGATVFFGIDATQLHATAAFTNNAAAATTGGPERLFDWILFSHPHLGLETLREDEGWHAERHHRLLAHYFWSAQQILTKSRDADARIYLCLCGNQPQTWRMLEAASPLKLVAQYDTSTPLPFSETLVELPLESHYAAPRKFRNGKLGSRHYLGKFGYQHRPTHPTSAGSTVNVAHSKHYIFQRNSCDGDKQASTVPTTTETVEKQDLVCQICRAKFGSAKGLQQHYEVPALPNDPPTTSTNTSQEASIHNKEPKLPVAKKIIKGSIDASSSLRPGPVEWSGSISLSSDVGQRLRQVLRNQEVDGLKSKRQAEDRIKFGCVSVNGVVAQDSSRFVQLGDVLEVRQLMTTTLNPNRQIDVIHRGATWAVAMKPVGMRTKGSFSEDTLESVVSKQLVGAGNGKYVSLSRLDKGCAGLCVLKEQEQSSSKTTNQLSIQHTFTALVYGRVDWTEITLEVSGDGGRRWKKNTIKAAEEVTKKRSLDQIDQGAKPNEAVREQVDEDDVVQRRHEDGKMQHTLETVRIKCTEQTSKSAPAISTLELTTATSTELRADHLCAALRQLGHGVVNDRFGRLSNEKIDDTIEQPQQLPRSMRNLIKNRLCIGCFAVRVTTKSDAHEKIVRADPPERLSAHYWQQRHDGIN